MFSLFQNVFFSSKNIWVLGSWSGRYYNDNSKYLYNYILENKPDTRAIWITDVDRIKNQLTAEGKECYKFNSLKGIYFCLVASVVVVSDSWVDLPIWAYLFPRRKKIIQLWHGTLLRKVNFNTGNVFRRIKRKLFISFLGRGYDLVISATDKNREIFLNLFYAKKFKTTGQPRIDGLINYKGLLKDAYIGKKIIIYLPTWRDNSYTLLNQKNKFDFKKINDELKKMNAVLIIKIHPYDAHKYSSLSRSEHIYFRSDMEDIYMYLSDVDILITDYSSVYFDFLILNKPIVFAPFDLISYGNEHGFYYNYDEMTPGPKAMNWDEVISMLKKILEGKDEFKSKRKKMNNDFNKYRDSCNSERVYTEILNLK